MNMKSLKCPNCNAPLDNPDDLEEFYCRYCGYYIVLADLTETDVKVKRMRHKERMRDKEYSENHASWARDERSKQYDFFRWIIIFGVLLAICFGIWAFTHFQSNQEEKELEQLYVEIMRDIKNENYSAARIKTQKLQYTSGESQELKEKWDSTREQIMLEIDKAEAETNKDSILDIFRKN